MGILEHASEVLGKLKDARIVYLPPMTVTACHFAGNTQEEEDIANECINTFIKQNGLVELKPDFRRFGFGNPAADQPMASLGYETWVSIPDNLEVPEPLMCKRFLGGQYAAHMVLFGEFDGWYHLRQWVMESEQYKLDLASRVDLHDPSADFALEEMLDAIHHLDDTTAFDIQLDLLVPIKPRA